MADLREVVGRRLREARRAAGLSQADVGVRLGISHVAVGDWERGRSLIGLDQLLAVCEMLGRPVSFVVGVSDEGLAGLDDLSREIVELVQLMPERERLAVLTYARFVAEQAARQAADESDE